MVQIRNLSVGIWKISGIFGQPHPSPQADSGLGIESSERLRYQDHQIINTTENLYQKYRLKRVSLLRLRSGKS